MCEVFAYVFHPSQIDAWCNCVRLLSAGAVSGLWRWLLRFGYMGNGWLVVWKYGIYGFFVD